MTDEGFVTVDSMSLSHLPNQAKLLLQRQKSSMIPKDAVQFGLPSTFINKDNGQTVWNKGPSIQIEQIPELIKMLQKALEEYSKKTTNKTVTFADASHSRY